MFDGVAINGNEINVRNRGNSGTGHGWAGAYMAVWNCKASSFSVRNPPTARNWLVGSIGTIDSSSGFSVGADPPGTYDSSGPTGTGKAVHMRSLYYGQLQQRMKWPGSDFREVWLGDVDQHSSTGGTGETVNCDATWLSQVEAIDFATLHLQVQKAQPASQVIILNPVADTYVMGGVNASTNYGTATTLVTKDDTSADFDRETFLRWDLSGVSGKIISAKVRLAGVTTGQTGNESCATFVSSDTWG